MISTSTEDSCLRAGVFFVFVAVLLSGGGVLWGCQSADDATPAERALTPLSHTYDTPEALAKGFLEALQSKDVEALKQFGLNEDEFRHHVWPELPVAKLDKPLPFEYGWSDLNQKSMNSLSRTYAAYGGRKLTFIRLEFEDETTDYETFKVHRDARVVVFYEERNEEMRLDLFGSIMEKNGRYKLFSYVTD